MSNKFKILYLEAKNFLIGGTVWMGVAAIFLFGMYGFYYGSQLIEDQQTTIDSVAEVQKRHLDQVIEHGHGKAAGSTAYYPFFYTYHSPSSWASFSIGQRDVNPFTLKVKMLAVEGQLYDSELTNPLTLLVGNLDASFVFVFLFPLLIIAFTYNIISDEQESGVWKMVSTTNSAIVTTIAIKIMTRFSVILVAALLLFLTGAVVLHLPLASPTLQLGAGLLFYVLFWFGIAVLVLSLNKSSSFNATTMVGIWIFLCILYPGIANILINRGVPVPEATQTAIDQREGYHEKWDLPKAPTMEKFYAAYPQYRKYPIPEDRYSSGWYYAMQFAGDQESANSSAKLFEKLHIREQLAEVAGLFNPVVGIQQLFNKVANTDLSAHIRYLSSVKEHHKNVRAYFYPFIFEETPTEDLDWHAYPTYQSAGYIPESIKSHIFSFAGWEILLFGISIILLRRNFIHIQD
jgi:ABC-2 type transport system permease protein